MGRTLKAICNVCQSDSKLIKRELINADFGFITFRCKNPQCDHEFVLELEYSHTTKPSKVHNKETQ